MKVLITGARGYIGSSLIKKIAPIASIVYCQSRERIVSNAEIQWIKHDLVEDDWASLNLPAIDVIFYLAGQTSIYEAQKDPLNDLKSNTFSFVRLLDFLRNQSNSPIVVYAGTITQVGLVNGERINENLPDCPITFYDTSKLCAELYLKQYIREGFLRGCSLRLPNIYGGDARHGSEDRGVLDKIYKIAMAGKNVQVYGDGKYLRDYVYIEDVADAFIEAAINIERTNGETYCIGSGRSIQLIDAFRQVVNICSNKKGKEIPIVSIDFPSNLSPIELRSASISINKFMGDTNWKPKYTFEEGLNITYSTKNK